MLEDIVIVALSRTHRKYAQKIAEYAGQVGNIINKMNPRRFSAGEYCPKFHVKGKNVYVIGTQGPFQSPQEFPTRVAFAADAAKRQGAQCVTLLAPDLPFSRQDRGPEEDPKMEGESFTAEVQAKIFREGGVDRIVSMHLHSQKLYEIYEKVYQKPGKEIVYGITPDFILANYLTSQKSSLKDKEAKDLVFVAVDKGSEKFVHSVRAWMNVPDSEQLIFDKVRRVKNKADAVEVDVSKRTTVSSLEGKTVIVPDDIWDTCGTIRSICNWINIAHPELAHTLGKPREIYLYATHPVFGPQHLVTQRELAKVNAKEYICTNSRPYIVDEQDDEFEEYSTILCMEKLFADAILNCCEKNIHPDERYSKTNEQIKDKIGRLYTIIRSERHFLEAKKREKEE